MSLSLPLLAARRPQVVVEGLFRHGEQGARFRLSDTSTLFQDSAGATPVTALGQAIGKLLDRSGLGNHASQATTTKRPVLPAAGYRLRSDFVDDALAVTLPAFNGEVWVNTPYGHYRTPYNSTVVGAYNLPLNDATDIIIREGATTQAQRDAISAYFGNAKAPYGSIMLSPDTSIVFNAWLSAAPQTATVVRFVGSNGASVDKTLETSNTNKTYDVSADGLTAPVAVIPLSIGTRHFFCNSNQLSGGIPDLRGSAYLVYLNTASNQLTGGISSIAGLTASTIYIYANQFTGTVPSLASNVNLGSFWAQYNLLSGVESGFAVAPSLGDFQAQNNNLTAAAVNAILAAFVAAGRTGINTLNIGGPGNAAPTGQGLTDKATLVSRGWTVTTN